MISASLNRRSENVVIETVVIAELKFRDVQRHIFAADLVKRADDTALEDAPEAFNRLSVDSADNILPLAMIDGCVGKFHAKVLIANPFVCAEQANLVRNGFVDESFQRRGADILDDAGNDVALAAHGSDNNGFVGAAGPRANTALADMLILGEAADKGFVNFNDAAQLRFGFDQCSADFVAHGMRRAVAPEAHDALNLEGANSLLAGEHQVRDAEPLAERLVRVLKDRARNMREAIAVHLASLALPVMAGCQSVNLGVAATRAMNAVRPSPRDQINAASFLIGERRLKLSDSHLVDWFGAAHGVSSVVGGYNHA
jgi:hypothetical protein